jgi:uncharacterized protein YoaH (UPF0181 family)
VSLTYYTQYVLPYQHISSGAAQALCASSGRKKAKKKKALYEFMNDSESI